MARKTNQFKSIQLPGRAAAQRLTLIALVVFGGSLLVMSRTHNPAMDRMKNGLSDITTPIFSVVASPVHAIRSAGGWMSDIVHMRQENIALKNQNAELLKWQSLAKQMEAENSSLKQMLHVVPQRKYGFTTASIVSDIGGPYTHTALIDAGAEDGIKKNQPVIGVQGLVGRVVELADQSARVLLLNDINSRVPVMNERLREKMILVGTNGSTPSLAYVSATSAIKPGDRIVTSGDGGMFPKGVPVGVVAKVEGGEVTVQPFIDPATLDYVSVMDFSL